ncbi:MAG TPA: leucine zipper domain-containing protein [Solirubrobacterales bacterium]
MGVDHGVGTHRCSFSWTITLRTPSLCERGEGRVDVRERQTRADHRVEVERALAVEVDGGRSGEDTEAAKAVGVIARTAGKWVGRCRAEGEASLLDRRSASRTVDKHHVLKRIGLGELSERWLPRWRARISTSASRSASRFRRRRRRDGSLALFR